jgi:hypothetical protein
VVTELKLQQVWNKRCLLQAEANEVFAKSYRIMLRGRVLATADGIYGAKTGNLYAEADLLEGRGRIVQARGYKIWADAVWKTYGDVTMKWQHNGDCRLDVNGGETYIWPSTTITRR